VTYFEEESGIEVKAFEVQARAFHSCCASHSFSIPYLERLFQKSTVRSFRRVPSYVD